MLKYLMLQQLNKAIDFIFEVALIFCRRQENNYCFEITDLQNWWQCNRIS